MKTKTKKDNRVYGTFWTCLECQGAANMSGKQLQEHLRVAHGFTGDTKSAKARMRMSCHMDGSDWYSSTYEGHIVLPDGKQIKAAHYSCHKRVGENAAMWSDC